uniref:C3H1-type domain-containing protein n=1 Tax=Strongyloides papillosus TaxID=174720 RepID=A0A0N5CAC2_STREA
MYCGLKIFCCILYVLHFVECQIVTFYYTSGHHKRKHVYKFKTETYYSKRAVAIAIVRDSQDYSPCCLYMQELKYEAFSRTSRNNRYPQPEPVLAYQKLEMYRERCSFKDSCPSKHDINVYYRSGLVLYECNGRIFRSFNNAKLYARRGSRRYYKQGMDSKIFFMNQQYRSLTKNGKVQSKL